MKPTLNEKLIAYLTLLSGLSVSAVAVYYSVAGLTAIFAAAVIPIIIMGVVLEVGKLVATLWLKQNWKIAPYFVRTYLIIAIAVLMVVTSMGIFGFLSKAHMDQSIPSGDVAAKIAIFDEKIKTERENIDANRKALKQMDEAVDQVMGRSTDQAGADKAVQIRRGQQKERSRLLSDIDTGQKKISKLVEDRAPVAAEVRKVEAEVGPIKYIAAFFYGETNPTILEKAVTWVIILLIVVFDPLAVILLLASQYSFQSFRSRKEQDDVIPLFNGEMAAPNKEPAYKEVGEQTPPVVLSTMTSQASDIKDVVQKLTDSEVAELWQGLKEAKPELFNSRKTYDWKSVPDGTEYVTIDGQKMSVHAGKALYPQSE